MVHGSVLTNYLTCILSSAESFDGAGLNRRALKVPQHAEGMYPVV